LPVGVLAGVVAGHRIARAEHTTADIVLLVALAVVILWCGLTAPRAIPSRPRVSNPDSAR
jgi:hypothetical protein